MIIVRLKGGLGNQMFQYAAAKSLAVFLETELIVDLVFLKYYPKSKSYTKRNFQLCEFDITASLINHENSFLSVFPNVIAYKLFTLFFEKKNKVKKISNLKNIRAIIDSKTNNYLLEGDFQLYQSFLPFKKLILNEFTPKIALSLQAEKYHKIISETNSVAIHIRRSDYLLSNNMSIYKQCTVEYYQKAVRYIADSVENPTFFVFGDDMEWAKININIDGNLFYYVSEKSISATEDMRLMSLCKHNITANSTFSWWSAWLNQNDTKIVITPHVWFNSGDETVYEDLIPKEWIKM